MIRRLVYDSERLDGGRDIVLAARLMGAVPNPAHYPDATSRGAYLTDPSVSVFIDDVAEQMVVVTYLPERAEVRLTWGLPLPVKLTIVDGQPVASLKTTPTATAALTGLRAVAHAANLDILARYPEAIDCRYVGSFQIVKADGTKVTSDGGRALCYGWKEYGFPTVHIPVGSDGDYSMWLPFSEVV